MTTQKLYVDILNRELEKRVQKNPRYSMRRFAQALNINPGDLSKILSSKKKLSSKKIKSVLDCLDLSPEMSQQFLQSVFEERTNGIQKRLQKEGFSPLKEVDRELDDMAFEAISEWYYYAIVELTKLPNFQAKPKWIASQLGITEIQAKLAVEKLLALHLIKIENGHTTATTQYTRLHNRQNSSAARRKHQRQILDLAEQSMDGFPVADRKISSLALSFNSDRTEEAKEMIDDFLRKFSAKFETGEVNSVYQMSLCYFPLTRKKQSKQQEK